MRRHVTIAMTLLGCVAAPAGAQDNLLAECAETPVPPGVPQQARDEVGEELRAACGRVVSALTLVQPAVGIAFSGGNPVLGSAAVPRVSVTARANVAFAEIPDIFEGRLDEVSGGEALRTLGTLGVPVGSLQGDVAIALFDGLSFGPALQGVGAIDLLGSVAFLPVIDEIGMNSPVVNAAGGARIGILEQGLVTPGVSVSVLYRSLLQDIDIGDIEAGDLGEFQAGLSTFSARAVVTKALLALDVAVGGGYDSYTSDVALRYRIECASQQCRDANQENPGDPIVATGDISGELSTAAWNAFGNVSFQFLVAQLVAEVGYQQALDVVTLDDLQRYDLADADIEDPGGGRWFGSLGVRVSF